MCHPTSRVLTMLEWLAIQAVHQWSKGSRVCLKTGCSLLKRHDAKRQREEWHYRIFQVKAVKVYDVPQEKAFCRALRNEKTLYVALIWR